MSRDFLRGGVSAAFADHCGKLLHFALTLLHFTFRTMGNAKCKMRNLKFKSEGAGKCARPIAVEYDQLQNGHVAEKFTPVALKGPDNGLSCTRKIGPDVI